MPYQMHNIDMEKYAIKYECVLFDARKYEGKTMFEFGLVATFSVLFLLLAVYPL